MNYTIAKTALHALFLILPLVPAVAEDWGPANLVVNPGFESADENGFPEQWHGDKAVYSRDTTVKRSGEASLKFVNTDPERYRLCNQSYTFVPGEKYEFSVWIKTENVQGDDFGATICIEFSDAEGKYVTGTYNSGGGKGDSDWKRYSAVSKRIPENVAQGTIACYLRKGMTGTAWWDDVELRRFRDDPLRIKLISPGYRSEITDAGPDTLRIVADTGNLSDYGKTTAEMEFLWRILPAEADQAIESGVAQLENNSETTLTLPGIILPPGSYRVEVDLKEKATGARLSSKACRVHRIDGIPERTSYIDAHNRLIHNGEPFFPLGMYWGSIHAGQLAIYAEGAFNCLMPYGMPTQAHMDMAHKHNLKVIYSVKDCYFASRWHPEAIQSEEDEYPFIKAKVEAYRDHPALLAWYLNDEEPLSELDRLILHKEWLEELDPNHPTWSVLYQIWEIGGYYDSCHAIGTDPYPIPTKPAAMAGEWTRTTVDEMCNAKPVWMVPQAFNWAAYKKTDADKAANRQPTIDEVRSMTWQCIAESARGLIFYSWFNMYDPAKNAGLDFDAYWPEFKEVVREVSDMAPVLLSIDTPPDISVEEQPWLNWTLRQSGDTTYLIAVNNGPDAQSAVFTLPEATTRVTDHRTGSVIASEEMARLPLTFESFGLRICVIE